MVGDGFFLFKGRNNMAWGGRKYNSGNSNKQEERGEDAGGDNNRGGFQKRNNNNQGRNSNKSGGRKFGRNSGGGNSDFETITSLFVSKSGHAFTVFLKPDHIEALHSLQEGDMIGVNQSSKDEDRFTLWVKRADNSAPDQGGDNQ